MSTCDRVSLDCCHQSLISGCITSLCGSLGGVGVCVGVGWGGEGGVGGGDNSV